MTSDELQVIVNSYKAARASGQFRAYAPDPAQLARLKPSDLQRFVQRIQKDYRHDQQNLETAIERAKNLRGDLIDLCDDHDRDTQKHSESKATWTSKLKKDQSKTESQRERLDFLQQQALQARRANNPELANTYKNTHANMNRERNALIEKCKTNRETLIASTLKYERRLRDFQDRKNRLLNKTKYRLHWIAWSGER